MAEWLRMVCDAGKWPDTDRRYSTIVKTLNIQLNSFLHSFICTAPAHNSSHIKACKVKLLEYQRENLSNQTTAYDEVLGDGGKKELPFIKKKPADNCFYINIVSVLYLMNPFLGYSLIHHSSGSTGKAPCESGSCKIEFSPTQNFSPSKMCSCCACLSYCLGTLQSASLKLFIVSCWLKVLQSIKALICLLMLTYTYRGYSS